MTRTSPGDLVTPWLIHRSSALTVGYSDADLRRARRSGELTVLAPGLYLRGTDPLDLDPGEWHFAAVTAAVSRLSGAPVVSHLSAAELHGFRRFSGPEQPVHVIRAAPAKSRSGRRIIAHRWALLADEVVPMGGLAVTSVSRTALDCAYLLPHNEAVALVAAAVNADQLTPEALLHQLARYARVPGVRRVTEVVRATIGLTESGHPPTVIRT